MKLKGLRIQAGLVCFEFFNVRVGRVGEISPTLRPTKWRLRIGWHRLRWMRSRMRKLYSAQYTCWGGAGD